LCDVNNVHFYFGGEPTSGGEAVPGDEEFSTELRLGRSASSIDIDRDKRPKPARPASNGKPDTKNKKSNLKSIWNSIEWRT